MSTGLAAGLTGPGPELSGKQSAGLEANDRMEQGRPPSPQIEKPIEVRVDIEQSPY
jgi:hypothetical protein